MKHTKMQAIWITLILTSMVVPSMSLAVEPKCSQPDILFIYLDDFGWKETSYMGSDFFETPHIDELAGEGMVFTNAYSCAANCAPSQGRHPGPG